MKSVISRDNMLFHPPELGSVLFLPGLPGSGNKIYDRSPYGNIGTLTGAAWVNTPGGVPCLSFDGVDDYVDVGISNIFNFSSAFTIEAWVKTNDVTTTYQTIFGRIKTSPSNTGYGVLKASGDGKTYIRLNASTTFSSTSPFFVNNAWVHIVVTFSDIDDKVSLYKNGQLFQAWTTSQVPPDTSDISTFVGKYSATSAYSWNGLIAMVRVYNGRLIPLQVMHNYITTKWIGG